MLHHLNGQLYSIVQNFVTKTKQRLELYHADDQYHCNPLKGALQERMLRAPSNMTNNAVGMLPFVLGMRVMVTGNVAMCGGVANGCQGILKNIKYEVNEYNERRAMCTHVHVPSANIHAPGLPHEVIPILPEKTSFKYNIPGQKGYNVSRSQLPLLPAYAYTANKIQGQSLKHALVDLKSAQGTQALYVMISCTMMLDNLAITCWFPSTNVNRQLSQAYRNEFDRLEKLDQQTTQDFPKRKWAPQQMCKPQLPK